MQILVVGSHAAGRYIPGFRVAKDLDVFSPDDVGADDTFWHPSFEDWIVPGTNRYATLDEMYTLKVSHSYWELPNGSWEKHIEDAAALRRNGATLNLDLHRLLYKVWEEKHGVKRVDLDQDKAAFFDDAVPRKYDHDSIHYSVAYGDTPIYESVFVDGAEIKMSMAKIKALPFEEQVRLYREEIYATALERWVIPSDYTVSPGLAYKRALRKTIVSLTKGWSARFLVENYDTFRRPDIDYIAHHRSKAHLLIPLEG